MRQRHSVDWHLIESGRGAFDCTSCQYHIIVFLTYMVPSVFCSRVYYSICLYGIVQLLCKTVFAELITILMSFFFFF